MKLLCLKVFFYRHFSGSCFLDVWLNIEKQRDCSTENDLMFNLFYLFSWKVCYIFCCCKFHCVGFWYFLLLFDSFNFLNLTLAWETRGLSFVERFGTHFFCEVFIQKRFLLMGNALFLMPVVQPPLLYGISKDYPIVSHIDSKQLILIYFLKKIF